MKNIIPLVLFTVFLNSCKSPDKGCECLKEKSNQHMLRGELVPEEQLITECDFPDNWKEKKDWVLKLSQFEPELVKHIRDKELFKIKDKTEDFIPLDYSTNQNSLDSILKEGVKLDPNSQEFERLKYYFKNVPIKVSIYFIDGKDRGTSTNIISNQILTEKSQYEFVGYVFKDTGLITSIRFEVPSTDPLSSKVFVGHCKLFNSKKKIPCDYDPDFYTPDGKSSYLTNHYTFGLKDFNVNNLDEIKSSLPTVFNNLSTGDYYDVLYNSTLSKELQSDPWVGRGEFDERLDEHTKLNYYKSNVRDNILDKNGYLSKGVISGYVEAPVKLTT